MIIYCSFTTIELTIQASYYLFYSNIEAEWALTLDDICYLTGIIPMHFPINL